MRLITVSLVLLIGPALGVGEEFEGIDVDLIEKDDKRFVHCETDFPADSKQALEVKDYLQYTCYEYVRRNFPEKDLGDMRELTLPSGHAWVALNNSTNRLYVDMQLYALKVPKRK